MWKVINFIDHTGWRCPPAPVELLVCRANSRGTGVTTRAEKWLASEEIRGRTGNWVRSWKNGEVEEVKRFVEDCLVVFLSD